MTNKLLIKKHPARAHASGHFYAEIRKKGESNEAVYRCIPCPFCVWNRREHWAALRRARKRPCALYVCRRNEDLTKEAAAILDGFAADDEVVVCTDLFGGSVNNEFTKIVQTRPNTHLVTNMNLPLLIQLLFVSESTPIDEAIRQIVEADDTKVKYVNDLLGQAELDEF